VILHDAKSTLAAPPKEKSRREKQKELEKLKSSVPAPVLEWWEDERVVLNVVVGDEDSEPLALAIDANNQVWVGLYQENRYVKLDGDTGEIRMSIPVPGCPRCAVIDSRGILFSADDGITMINTRTGKVIRHLDTEAYSVLVQRELDKSVSPANDIFIDLIIRVKMLFIRMLSFGLCGFLWRRLV